jgi:starvation-inducible DNA-binding protein
LVGKQLHWNLSGPLFRPLHLELDELVDVWYNLADEVAERAVAIGIFPDGQADAIAAGSGMAPVAKGGIEDTVVIRELAHRLATTSEQIRTRMDRLGELDAVSQDVLIGVLGTLEKQLWMIRAQFPQ